MARIKNDIRSCRLCSHKKMSLKNVCYRCDNPVSEHYNELIKDETEIRNCKGGNGRRGYEK